ncbi:MAG: hypothetical protein C4326_14820 [Ignavibacteria bacterium]
MSTPSLHTLAALLCAYALFEFVLKRLVLGSLSPTANATAHALCLALLLLGTMSILTVGMLTPTLAAGYAVLAASAFAYEVTSAHYRWNESRKALEWYAAKQITAGGVLFAVWQLAAPPDSHAWYAELERSCLTALGSSVERLNSNRTLILAVISAYAFVVDGGTRIVRGVFNKFPVLYDNVVRKLSRNKERGIEENVGEWIGVLERLITLTFVLTGSFTALAFALTAKSIARFKELEDKEFAEYYLLGTSSSLLVALFAGMMLTILFDIR